jgi:hypothetical protein
MVTSSSDIISMAGSIKFIKNSFFYLLFLGGLLFFLYALFLCVCLGFTPADINGDSEALGLGLTYVMGAVGLIFLTISIFVLKFRNKSQLLFGLGILILIAAPFPIKDIFIISSRFRNDIMVLSIILIIVGVFYLLAGRSFKIKT